MGTAVEVAGTAVFLASDDASFFVGQALAPNSGISMERALSVPRWTRLDFCPIFTAYASPSS